MLLYRSKSDRLRLMWSVGGLVDYVDLKRLNTIDHLFKFQTGRKHRETGNLQCCTPTFKTEINSDRSIPCRALMLFRQATLNSNLHASPTYNFGSALEDLGKSLAGILRMMWVFCSRVVTYVFCCPGTERCNGARL